MPEEQQDADLAVVPTARLVQALVMSLAVALQSQYLDEDTYYEDAA